MPVTPMTTAPCTVSSLGWPRLCLGKSLDEEGVGREGASKNIKFFKIKFC